MVAKDHPEVIEGRRWLIYVDVLESEETAEDASIVHDDAAEIEEDGSGLVGGILTEEVQDMQKASKSSSLSSYILKPSSLLTQGFEKNRTAQEKLFKHMCILGHGQSGGRGEVLSVLILMLRPPKINAVS